ncbi:uncharacterized protein LOC131878624 isoform X1 [Tigriopus californicus]|uniref:uncharacterized protein LOC131878624 isoform X1 n=2 Tax=Tigriopus californicus TaxID=6832 RepID=UPI0027DA5472|nr:uncharacterized protein LOC131878624 isoform X1 [Tigriopus californicus]
MSLATEMYHKGGKVSLPEVNEWHSLCSDIPILLNTHRSLKAVPRSCSFLPFQFHTSQPKPPIQVQRHNMFNPRVMDINSRTRCSRPNKRYELLEGQWEHKRYLQHQQRLRRTKSMVDIERPKSSLYTHVQLKAKKQQKLAERNAEVMNENLILLRHLAEIATSKRVDDGFDTKKIHWQDYMGTIIAMRRQQVQWLKSKLEDNLANIKLEEKADRVEGTKSAKKKRRAETKKSI